MADIMKIKPQGQAESVIIAMGEMLSQLQEIEIEEIIDVNIQNVDSGMVVSGSQALLLMANEMVKIASLAGNIANAHAHTMESKN